VPIDQVQLPGPIVTAFDWTREAAAYALAFVRQAYPVRGPSERGHFQDSHQLLLNGRLVPLTALTASAAVAPVAIGDEWQIVNSQPYARKVEVGAEGFRLGQNLYRAAAAATRRRWGRVADVRATYTTRVDGYQLRAGGGALRYPVIVISRAAG
jgi:hypothetical protein